MPADVESMFSAREVPWHGLGTITEDALTSEAAIIAAGLDWKVLEKSLYVPTQDGKSKIKWHGKKALIRDSDWAGLGIVSDQYNVFQNSEAFAFLDTLVAAGEAIYETAGSLRNGKTIFITAKIPKAIMVGGVDRHDMYIVLTTTHDGTGAVKVLITPVRVVCTNTLTMALREARNRFTVAHNRTMKGRIQEARETLQLTFEYAAAFEEKAEELLKVKVTDDQFSDVVYDLFAPHNKDTEPAHEIVMDLWKNAETVGFHGTAWGGFNALSEFFEHHGRQRSLEARFSAIIGWQEKFRAKTAARLLELA